MPPVLTSGNYNYDYDTVQPYFLLDGEEEDFYLPRCSQLLPGPGEDIWKKFELLPTPPLSPRRTPSPSQVPLSAAEHLEAVSDLLDEDRNPSATFLQSFIIQDCMWSSSFAAATKLEEAVSQRLAMLRARRDSAATTTSADRQVPAGRQQDLLHAAAADCVDPSVVFPYGTPSRKSGGDGAVMEVASELCVASPALSSSESESEEEEEEEGEEDGEIDVVTVDGRKAPHRPSGRRGASPLVLKRSHVDIHQHNYAAPGTFTTATTKRLKLLRGGGGSQGCRSPAWSVDSEDGEDRRRTHNVLERQRRNELKMSFAALRDQVPAVADNEKAAKVTILKKATQFIAEIREEERRLLTTKDALRKRSRQLRRRLEQLRTSH